MVGGSLLGVKVRGCLTEAGTAQMQLCHQKAQPCTDDNSQRCNPGALSQPAGRPGALSRSSLAFSLPGSPPVLHTHFLFLCNLGETFVTSIKFHFLRHEIISILTLKNPPVPSWKFPSEESSTQHPVTIYSQMC